MKTSYLAHLFAPCFALLFTLTAHGQALTGTSLSVTGAGASNLTGVLNVVGSIDSDSNTFTFGTQSGSYGGAMLYTDSATDTLKFLINRNPSSWAWVHNSAITAMRLDSAHQLILYQADGATAGLTFTPVSNQISLGTATLTGSGTGLTAGGAFTATGALTASAGITNTNGTLTGGASGLTLNSGTAGTNMTLTAAGAGDIVFNTNSLERVRIKSTGNVGIGTTDPSRLLSLNGAANSYLGFKIADVLQSTMGSDGNADFFIFDDQTSSYRLVVNTAGNVGIGTTSPSGKLQISNGGGGAYQRMSDIVIQRSDATNTTGKISFVGSGGTGSTRWEVVSDADIGNDFGFSYNGSKQLQLLSNGNVGIGNTSPAYKLDVNGDVHITSGRFIHNSVHGDYEVQQILAANNGAGSGDAGLYSWVSEPGVTWTGAGIGRNMRNSAENFPRVNTGLTGQMMRFDEGLGIRFTTETAGGTRYNPMYLSGNDMIVNGNLGLGTTAPQSRLQLGSLSDGTGEATNHGDLLFSKQNTSLAATGGIEWKISPDNYGAKIDTISNGGANIVFGLRNASSTWTEAMRINPAGNVGIGTTTPNASLDNWKDYNAGTDSLRFSFNDGSAYWMGIQPYVVGGGNVGYRFRTNNVNTTVDAMAITGDGNVGIGTLNPTHKLSVKGTIRAQEIIVDNTNWADYVFEDSYRLAPLAEVEQHIKSNKHLPGIPSAAEIAEHGVSMGVMQSKLLSKIEELTLHMIAQQKEIAALKTQNTNFQSQLSELKATNP